MTHTPALMPLQSHMLDIYGKIGHVILQFNNHVFSEENARKFLHTYVALVETLCRSKIYNLSIFNPAEPMPVTALETDRSLAVTPYNLKYFVSFQL